MLSSGWLVVVELSQPRIQLALRCAGQPGRLAKALDRRRHLSLSFWRRRSSDREYDGSTRTTSSSGINPALIRVRNAEQVAMSSFSPLADAFIEATAPSTGGRAAARPEGRSFQTAASPSCLPCWGRGLDDFLAGFSQLQGVSPQMMHSSCRSRRIALGYHATGSRVKPRPRLQLRTPRTSWQDQPSGSCPWPCGCRRSAAQ